MITLGINAAFHDPSAALVEDGVLLSAAEEERFTHVKHGKRPTPFTTYELPFHAIDFCLKQRGITISEVDHIAYSFDPSLLLGPRMGDERIELPLEPSAHPLPAQWSHVWEPLFLSSIVNAPRHLTGGGPHHLSERLNGVRHPGPWQWHFIPHHIAHAASAYLPSPFDQAAILCLDGRGERTSTTYGYGSGSKMEFLEEVSLPHSLGLLYEEVTRHLGFLHSSDEYKVMALASFGKPRYAGELEKRICLRGNGRYTIAPLDLSDWFGPARRKGSPLEAEHFDLACSLQTVLEKVVLELAGWLHGVTGCKQLCMAGGVALNCVLNARLRDEGPFEDIWVQPAAGDAGTALGAALYVDQRECAPPRSRRWQMNHAYWGPEFGEAEIEEFLRWSKLSYRRMASVAEETADLLAGGKIIGWFQGALEFGPRALGGRSILASPTGADMQARLNDLKEREDFRPVAPVVLEERANEWFADAATSPFMLFIHQIRKDRAERIPAVSHIDGTARIQTVRRDQHALYYDLLKAFETRTGVPILVNTSFNTRGEPIVCTPRDAIEAFWSSPLDALVIGPFCLEKQ